MVKSLLKFSTSIQQVIFTLLSILYTNSIFRSRFLSKSIDNSNRAQRVAVVANGPGALADFKLLNEVQYDFVVTVNDGVCTDFFFETRPKYHFLMDPFFFDDSNSRVTAIQNELKKVNWDFSVVVPNRFLKEANAIYQNTSIIGVNTNEIRGNSKLANLAFRNGLGMPRAQNVLIAVISYLIWNKATYVYLCGASHDWSRYMEVDQNKLYLRAHHYFDGGTERKLWLDPQGRNYKVHEALYKLSLMFKSYDWLARYLRENAGDTRVIVKSKDTLIDSF